MQLEDFHALLTPRGQEVLQSAEALAPCEDNFLRDFTFLQRRASPELARTALEMALLRQSARRKFPWADRMYFTRPALEQASAQAVSAYRAGRFRPFARLADLGCSVGGDTLALARLAPTLGIDLDRLRLGMAQANVEAVREMEAKAAQADPIGTVDWVQADLTAALPFAGGASAGANWALFFDPARRDERRRAFSVEQYTPPLRVLVEWLPLCPAIGVKVSPGVNLEELAGYDCEVEFISLEGELKEAVLWFGPMRSAVLRRATVLPGPFTLVGASPPVERPPLRPPLAYLYEPDPSVLRAGLVTTLAGQLGAAQLDTEIAYLTAEQLTPTAFGRAWAVEDWFPFHLKKLRAYLRQRGVGRVTVKKRGSPLTPEGLIRDLRLEGDLERTLFLTHLQGKPIVVVAHGPVQAG